MDVARALAGCGSSRRCDDRLGYGRACHDHDFVVAELCLSVSTPAVGHFAIHASPQCPCCESRWGLIPHIVDQGRGLPITRVVPVDQPRNPSNSPWCTRPWFWNIRGGIWPLIDGCFAQAFFVYRLSVACIFRALAIPARGEWPPTSIAAPHMLPLTLLPVRSPFSKRHAKILVSVCRQFSQAPP